MASSYPGSLDSFATSRTDATTMATTHAADHNNANDAINKIEAELGVNPSGVYTDVAARLAAIGGSTGGTYSPIFNVKDAAYGATGDGTTNDTTAIQAAIDAANTAGGGVVYFPKGTYICNGLTLYANITVAGAGAASVLKQPAGVADGNHLLNVNQGTGGTADPAANTKNVVIRDVTLQGRADVDAFTEQVHLVNLNAVTDVAVFNVRFVNWRGDAIYLGSGNTGLIERHNENVLVVGCTFDGTTSLKNNRNAISIIDGSWIRILGNTFRNHTTSTMPGAIDVEPNPSAQTFARCRHIYVIGNTFFNVGGSNGVVGLFLQNGQSTFTHPVHDIHVTNNTFKDCDNTMMVYGLNPEQAGASTPPFNYHIAENHMEVGGKINTATITVASPAVITTAAAHDLQVNDHVYLGTTGALPTGLAADTAYWVVAVPSATTLRVSATRGGAAINTSGTQSGTHTLYRMRQTEAIELAGIKGADIRENTVTNFSTIPFAFGYTYNCHSIEVEANTLRRCSQTNGRLFYIFRLQYGWFVGNEVDTDNYVETPVAPEVFRFDQDGGATGASDHVYAVQNHIRGAGSATFSTKTAGHTTSPTTNVAFTIPGDSPAPSASHWTIGQGTRGTSTQTPGAVTTVNIPHGLGATPTGFQAQPANTAARGAPAFYLTADGTNVTLNFASALTAATSYSWVWSATP